MGNAITVPASTHAFAEHDLAAAAFLARYTGDTRKLYASDLRIYFEWCQVHDLEPLAVQRVHLEFFARHLEDDRRNGPASVHRRLSTLKGFYRLAHADDRIVKDPTLFLKMPKVRYDEARALGLDRQDLSHLVYTARQMDPRDDALIAMLALLGLRVSEACSVQIEDFQDRERGHRVLRLIGKGGKPATIPLPPPVVRSLERAAGDRTSGQLLTRQDGQPLERGTAYRWVKRIAKKAGITGRIYPHALRHSAITAALDAGAPLRDAQVFARHSDPRVTTRYDRGRMNLDRHASYLVSSYISGAA